MEWEAGGDGEGDGGGLKKKKQKKNVGRKQRAWRWAPG